MPGVTGTREPPRAGGVGSGEQATLRALEAQVIALQRQVKAHQLEVEEVSRLRHKLAGLPVDVMLEGLF